MSKVQLAFIGVGRMGCIRLRAARKNTNCKIKYIVDLFQREKAMSLAKRYDAEYKKTLEEALLSGGLDAVWVSTGTNDHFETIAKCLRKKIPVATEKPVAETSEKIAELFDMAGSVPLFCSFQRRFDRSYLELVHNIDRIGKLHSGNVVFRDHPVPPKEFLITGGDVFVDLTVHDLDYTRFATKQEPNFVWAKSFTFDNTLRYHGVKEAAKLVLIHPSDLTVAMDISRISSYGYDNRLEFSGELGCLHVNNPHRSTLRTFTSSGIAKDVFDYSFPERFQDAFQAEMDHFLDIIMKDQLCRVTRLDCIRSLQIAIAASRSDSEDRGIYFELEDLKIRYLQI